MGSAPQRETTVSSGDLQGLETGALCSFRAGDHGTRDSTTGTHDSPQKEEHTLTATHYHSTTHFTSTPSPAHHPAHHTTDSATHTLPTPHTDATVTTARPTPVRFLRAARQEGRRLAVSSGVLQGLGTRAGFFGQRATKRTTVSSGDLQVLETGALCSFRTGDHGTGDSITGTLDSPQGGAHTNSYPLHQHTVTGIQHTATSTHYSFHYQHTTTLQSTWRARWCTSKFCSSEFCSVRGAVQPPRLGRALRDAR